MPRAIRRKIYVAEAAKMANVSEAFLNMSGGEYRGPVRRSDQYGIRYWFEDEIKDWLKHR
ncbi:MAG TPA: hypothetical protein VJN01_15940 [Xanthomonadales bacterium]|nr:hypothetical protein [Xanthomonadales bacterium]